MISTGVATFKGNSMSEQPNKAQAGKGRTEQQDGNAREAQQAGARVADEARHIGGAGAEQTRQATEEAARRSAELMRENLDTAQRAMQVGVDVANRSFETISRAMSQVIGVDGDAG